jgi:hypothetical protein
MGEEKPDNLLKEFPAFASEAEEAEFWDSHSPLDFMEPQTKPLILKKDRVITMRLDNRTYTTLKALAKKYKVGMSTLVRVILIYNFKNKRRLRA